MTRSKIEWTDRTWNPARGCSRISAGCVNCYAERQAARFSDEGQYAHGFVERTTSGPRWTGRVELVESKLLEPLSWTKPSRVFVNSMSDLFHEKLSDADIDKVFAVMALADEQVFQVLTKRADRMREYCSGLLSDARREDINAAMEEVREATGRCTRECAEQIAPPGSTLPRRFRSPLKNVWLGVSCEDQASADKRIPDLLATPAAVRFLSCEPLIGPVDLEYPKTLFPNGPEYCCNGFECGCYGKPIEPPLLHGIDWVIVGGESGPGARPCDVSWIRSIVKQCKDANVACFVKQLGALPTMQCAQCGHTIGRVRSCWVDICGPTHAALVAESQRIRSSKGGSPEEWSEDLRVRQFPDRIEVPK